MPETDAPEMFAYEKRYWYPHMKPADIAIWERFIEKHPDMYDRCQYDVCVGDDPRFDTQVGEATDDATWKLYQKKIDVVVYSGDKIDIIELKPNAGASAVGQIKLYGRLYMKDYSPAEMPKLRIITNAASRDIVEFAKAEGVEVIVV